MLRSPSHDLTQLLRVTVTMLLAAAVTACLITPVPVIQKAGPEKSSRANIAETSAASIGTGSTTRRQVLLSLGEPDGRGTDDLWFTYGELARRGGVTWAMFFAWFGSGGADTFKELDVSSRLTVHFDEVGTVSSVSFESRDCTEKGVFVVGSGACLSAVGADVPDTGRAFQLIIPPAGAVLARHSTYVTSRTDGAACMLDAGSELNYGGALAVTEQALVRLKGVDEWEYLPWDDVRDVGVIESNSVGTGRWIPLFATNGSCYFFTVIETHPHELDDLRSEIEAAFAAHKSSTQ